MTKWKLQGLYNWQQKILKWPWKGGLGTSDKEGAWNSVIDVWWRGLEGGTNLLSPECHLCLGFQHGSDFSVPPSSSCLYEKGLAMGEGTREHCFRSFPLSFSLLVRPCSKLWWPLILGERRESFPWSFRHWWPVFLMPEIAHRVPTVSVIAASVHFWHKKRKSCLQLLSQWRNVWVTLCGVEDDPE